MRKTVLAVTSFLALICLSSAASAQYYGGPGYGPPGYGPGGGYGGGYGGGGQICANEGGFCGFRGTALVRYGANGRYITRRVRNGIPCANEYFGGDPFVGVVKHCIIN